MLGHTLKGNFGKIEGIEVGGPDASAIFSGLGTHRFTFVSKP